MNAELETTAVYSGLFANRRANAWLERRHAEGWALQSKRRQAGHVTITMRMPAPPSQKSVGLIGDELGRVEERVGELEREIAVLRHAVVVLENANHWAGSHAAAVADLPTGERS